MGNYFNIDDFPHCVITGHLVVGLYMGIYFICENCFTYAAGGRLRQNVVPLSLIFGMWLSEGYF